MRVSHNLVCCLSCMRLYSVQIYTECQCVAINLNNSLASATAEVGRCRNTNCKALVPFVFLLIAMMFVTFMNNVPAVEVVLQ